MQTQQIQVLQSGTITSPKGFLAGATYAGLKTFHEEKLDLGVLYSESPCVVAGMFTTNRIIAAPLVLNKEHLQKRPSAQALIANSGCANACVGPQGLADAKEMASLAAKKLSLKPEDVMVASTGIIGVELPMALIRRGVQRIEMSKDNGHLLARAIMTTDRRPKEAGVSLEVDGKVVAIGGVSKGAGMIHPNMATMLGFLTTDAAVEPAFLHQALKEAVDDSYNMITVDGDTSTNDMALIFANGQAGNRPLTATSKDAEAFRKALLTVCIRLAKEIARDGEGSDKIIQVTVEGAASGEEARQAARTIAGSTLVKTAVHGNDPNWGRVVAALGRSGVRVEDTKLSLYINEICTMDGGMPIAFYKDAAVQSMKEPEIFIRVSLGLGVHKAVAWGCDMTEEYVRFNSEYTT